MYMHRRTRFTSRWLIVPAALAVVLAACGGDAADDSTPAETDAASGTEDAATPDPSDEPSEPATDDTPAGDDDMSMDEGMDMSGDYGEAADPSEADRVIEVNVDNELAFEPSEFEVAAGEVVTFRITNTGDIEHEFVLGDEEAQNAMAEAMESGDDHAHSGDMSNAVTIHAGETGELTWRFSSPGTVLIGCHVPGHYEAGMSGTVTVTE